MHEFTRNSPVLLFAFAMLTLAFSGSGAEPEDLTALDQQINKLLQQRKYNEAIPLAEEAVETAKRIRGPEHPDTATKLNLLGRLYQEVGAYASAEAPYEEAFQIRQKVLGHEHPATVQSLNNLAELHQATGDYAKAEPLLQEALQICRKVLGEQHPNTATSLNNLAELYRDMGNYPKAEPLLQEALQIFRKVLGNQYPSTATSLNNLAELYQAIGDYSKAEPLLQEALQTRRKILGDQHPSTATSLNNLAELYQAVGDYSKAEPLLQEALQIRRKVLGRQHPDTAQSLNNLAELYEAMGDYAKAEPLLQEALEICRNGLGNQHPNTVTSLSNLAALYRDMGEYAKAEPLLQEALQIRRKALGNQHPDTATSLDNLAALYRNMGEYAKAEPLYEEALQICRKVLGDRHPDTVTSLNNLAELYRDKGDYTKAEPLFQEAVEISRGTLGTEYSGTAVSLINLALLEFDVERIEEARALARQAAEAQRQVLSKIFSFTSEPQRLAYLNIFNPYTLFPLLKGSEVDLAVAILRYKGAVLDSIIEDRRLAEASADGEERKRVEQLNANRRRLDQLLLQPSQGLSPETSQGIEALEREVENIESQLALRVAGLGQTRRALSVSVEQVQPTIPDDGALIEYLRYSHYLGRGKWEPRYGAIVLFSKGAPLWIVLAKANEVEHLVRRYGALMRGSPLEEELAANLQALYEALWAPIGQALPSETKKIIISPDGQLNFVSFATLLTREEQFLAQKYDIRYVASGRDLLRELRPSTATEVVLFANPDFAVASTSMLAKADGRSSDTGSKSIRGSEKREIEDWSFGSLEGTQKERNALIEKFTGWDWKPRDFTAKEATKEALLKIHSPYILHVATHGFFAKEDPTTAQTEPEASLSVRQSVVKSKFFKNPMHRSGLALAGAQTTIEAWKHEEVPPVENDGILTAEDVSTLDLQGTWLVTLSACDTGSGEARAGEGVMGLRRGFIQAGARNLLMTLWPISDEVTVEIMSDFYQAAHDSGNAPEALAKVQREWLLKLRTEKGLAQAVNLAGPFIVSSQGKP